MKKLLLTLWCLAPVAAAAYHFGPGQDGLQRDEAAARIAEARELTATARAFEKKHGEGSAKDLWARAQEQYDEALAFLPDDELAVARRLRLEKGKCQMLNSELPQANVGLQQLVDELIADPEADPELLRDARATYANSQYYMTWLQRLEGAPREEWEQRVDSARQTYKLLAEDAATRKDDAAHTKSLEDLEATVRLERMDLDELAGLPLPSQ